jgi:hypothetical protein
MAMGKGKPGCLAGLLSLIGGGQAGPERLPYRLRDDFLSAAELSFFHVLEKAFGGRFTICPKVRLGDLVFVAQPNRNMAYVNKVQGKHVDFVLGDPRTMRPVAAVELDDSSHARADRRKRDEFVNAALEAAGLPVVRVPAGRTYEPGALREILLAALESQAPAAVGDGQDGESADMPAASTTEGGPPICPKCGVPMVRRTAKRGEHRGQAFFGCPNYPRCRETVEKRGGGR